VGSQAGTLPALFGFGFALGWSVAWPPGPINAEIARRVLARGFWSGFGLVLGACSGDAVWAVLVALGAGALLVVPLARLGLGVLSTALLFAMAFLFLRGAWRASQVWRGLEPAPAPGRFEGARGGYLLGLSLALTSPWNAAFWLAVIGRPEAAELGLAGAAVLIAAVVLGAAAWGGLFGAILVVLGRGFGGALWEAIAKAATGLLMLGFALRSLANLLAG
jgi:threonine/homoserine/homoserine lactone efflux protein